MLTKLTPLGRRGKGLLVRDTPLSFSAYGLSSLWLTYGDMPRPLHYSLFPLAILSPPLPPYCPPAVAPVPDCDQGRKHSFGREERRAIHPLSPGPWRAWGLTWRVETHVLYRKILGTLHLQCKPENTRRDSVHTISGSWSLIPGYKNNSPTRWGHGETVRGHLPQARLVLTDVWRLTFWDSLLWEGEEIRGWKQGWGRKRKTMRKRMKELLLAEKSIS